MKDFKDTEGKNHKKSENLYRVLWGPKGVGGISTQRKWGENLREFFFKNRRKILMIIWYFQNFKKPKISSRKIFPKFRNKDQTDFSKNALQMVN